MAKFVFIAWIKSMLHMKYNNKDSFNQRGLFTRPAKNGCNSEFCCCSFLIPWKNLNASCKCGHYLNTCNSIVLFIFWLNKPQLSFLNLASIFFSHLLTYICERLPIVLKTFWNMTTFYKSKHCSFLYSHLSQKLSWGRGDRWAASCSCSTQPSPRRARWEI